MNTSKDWRMVPVEPTLEMVEAGMNSTGDQLNGRPVWKAALDEQAAHIFRAMLDAAPPPPAQQDDEALEALRLVLEALVWEVGSEPALCAGKTRRAIERARALLTKRGAA